MESQQIRKVSGLFKGCPGPKSDLPFSFFGGGLGGTFLQTFNMIKMPHPTFPHPSNRHNVRIQCQLVRLLLWHYQIVVRWCHGHPKASGWSFVNIQPVRRTFSHVSCLDYIRILCNVFAHIKPVYMDHIRSSSRCWWRRRQSDLGGCRPRGPGHWWNASGLAEDDG